jgi:membrane protease YdiL (CAAX protease family)
VLDSAPDHSSFPLIDEVPAGPRDEGTDQANRLPEPQRRILPIERLGAFIEVFLCSGFPTQVMVVGALAELGMRVQGADGNWSPRFIVAMSFIDMVFVIGLVTLFLRAHHEPLREFLLGRRRPAREVLLGILLIPAAFILVVLVLAVVLSFKPSLHNVPVNPFERMLQTPRDAAVFAVVVMLAGGVREEIQRAFIIRRFDRYLGGPFLGIGIYSIIFGLGHLEQGYAAAIATGTLGAAWGGLYWARRSVVAPIISHAGFNLAQLLKYVSLVAR